MRSSDFNSEISVWRKSVTQDPAFGSQDVEWVPLVAVAGSPTLSERFPAQVQDVLPSRMERLSEDVRNSMQIGTERTRIRMRYRNDIDSSMKITVHRDTDIDFQIIGGPAVVGIRKEMIEIVCEKYTSQGDAP
jgi:hypothetical protein